MGLGSAIIKGLLPLISTTYLVQWLLGSATIPTIAIEIGGAVAIATSLVQCEVVIPSVLLNIYSLSTVLEFKQWDLDNLKTIEQRVKAGKIHY